MRRRLRINGAIEAEIEFLLSGRRVELNAMPSDVFVRFVEEGLRAHGVAKVIPGREVLAEAYAAMKRGDKAQAALRQEMERLIAEPIKMPQDLVDRVNQFLAAHPASTWALAVAAVATKDQPPKEEAKKKPGDGAGGGAS